MYLNRFSMTRGARGVKRPHCDEYAVHQMIWEAFSDHPGRSRDFLYRIEDGRSRPTIYSLSRRPPGEIHGCTVESARFQPVLEPGETLLFKLRANPVVSRPAQEGGRSKRHDVVTDLQKQEGAPHGAKDPSILGRVGQGGLDWLRNRAAKSGFGFKDDEIRIDGYRRHVLKKPGGGPPIRFSSMEFSGRLIVEAPKQFFDSLRTGLGPAKGFGMGLMLIRPDRQSLSDPGT